MTHITLDPYIPLALWAPLALATVGLLGWYAAAGRRRVPGARWWVIVTLMCAAAVVPLAILLNPTWLERIPPPAGKPLLTILVDRSASMGTRDADRGQTRYQAATDIATTAEAQLKDRYEVQIRTFADTSSPCAAESLSKQQADGPSTDLAAAVQEAVSDDRPQGQAILLLSDGIDNRGAPERLRQVAAKAKAMAAPVYARTLGGPASVVDLEVALEQPQELALVGQRVPVAVALRQRGTTTPKAALSLLLDGKLVERRDATLKPDGVVEEVFYIAHKHSGLYRYEIRAEPLRAEVTAMNNTAAMLLRVVDQPVRVLLLEGKPYWDTKFLVRTLSADPSIELTSIVQLAEGRLLRRNIPRHAASGETSQAKGETKQAKPGASAAPDPEQWTIEKDAEKYLSDASTLASYQIVILGRGAEIFLTDDALVRLRKWLAESEGSLVCFRGPPTSQIGQRLGELMPLRWAPTPESRFRVQLTGVGQALRWLPASDQGNDALTDLPSLATGVRPQSTKALAVVLATAVVGSGEPTPVMAYQPVGSGRVVVIEGAGMWRWAFLPPEKRGREEVYGSLWRSLLRWLVANVGLLPSQRLAVRSDKLTFSTDENATATLLVRDWTGQPPKAELSGGSLPAPRTIACVPRGSEPGQYSLPLGMLPEGRYSLRIVGIDKDDPSAVTGFDVRGNLTERLDVRAQPGLMKLLAEQSGGAMLDDSQPKILAEQFDEHLTRTRPQRIAQTMAWDRWWALLGAFALWGAAWSLRRRSGLV